MTESGLDLGLSDATRAGVYFVTSGDLDSLGMAARDAGLQVRRIDLSGCHDKATLLLRIALALDFPGTFGRNWDALSDNLRDLEWMPAIGYALLFDQAGELRDTEEADFDTLLDILDEASIEWTTRASPFWAFLALPQAAFDEMDAAVSEDG